MSRFVVTAIACLSIAAIVLSAGSVLVRSGHRAGGGGAGQLQAAGEDEGGAPDLAARGVIVARANNLVYRLTPDGRTLGSAPDPSLQSSSASGQWQAYSGCQSADSCALSLARLPFDGQLQPVALPSSFFDGAWSGTDDTFAALTADQRLFLVTPADLGAREIGAGVTAFAWTETGGLVYATWNAGSGSIGVVSGGKASIAGTLTSAVSSFVASPDGRKFAFTLDRNDGWRLATVTDSGVVSDWGNLGRLKVAPAVAVAPQVAISWSPDSARIAVSPVTAPFAMYLLRDAATNPEVFDLKEGYAGEMKWSPDGRQLAVSTYSLDRSQHRVYVLDSPASTEMRKLIDGCLIFWSPDGRYLVVKPEPYTNSIAAVRVSDAAFWTVSEHMNLTPAAWGADEGSALKLAELPARGVGGLGK
jgi:dipeptidyl aminopeptidase/acylaminoacyl peptidase